MNVAAEPGQVGIGVDQDRLVPPAEKRPIPSRRAVHTLREDAAEMPHGPAEIAARRLQQQVIMVAHQAIGVRLDAEGFLQIAQQRQERAAARRIVEHLPPSQSPVHHMIPGTFVFDPQRSRHADQSVRALKRGQVLLSIK